MRQRAAPDKEKKTRRDTPESMDFSEKEKEFPEDKENEFLPQDNTEPHRDTVIRSEAGRRNKRIRAGVPGYPIPNERGKETKEEPGDKSGDHSSDTGNRQGQQENRKEKHTARQQKNYRLKREFDPVTGKETYRRFFDARNSDRGLPLNEVKAVTASGVDFMHHVNGEEDDNSGTEAAGSAVRTGSRFQDFIYERGSHKGRKSGHKSSGKTAKHGGKAFRKASDGFRENINPFSKQDNKENGQKEIRKAFQ